MTISEAEKAELKEMFGKATKRPCPFKIGDMVVCVNPDPDFGPRRDEAGIVLEVGKPDKNLGWDNTGTVLVLYKKHDKHDKFLSAGQANPDGFLWDKAYLGFWRFKLA